MLRGLTKQKAKVATPINYITEKEAAAMLGYKPSVLRVFVRNPKRAKLPIRSKKLNHKTVIYSKTDIETYINN